MMELWKQTSLTSIQWVQGTPRWRTYFLVHGYIEERWKWMGELLLFFLFIVFFSDGSGECHRCQDIFLLALSFSFWEQVTLCKKKNRGKWNRWGAWSSHACQRRSGSYRIPHLPTMEVRASFRTKLDCTFPRCQSIGSGQFDTQE